MYQCEDRIASHLVEVVLSTVRMIERIGSWAQLHPSSLHGGWDGPDHQPEEHVFDAIG
jgi:hypothetical protein